MYNCPLIYSVSVRLNCGELENSDFVRSTINPLTQLTDNEINVSSSRASFFERDQEV